MGFLFGGGGSKKAPPPTPAPPPPQPHHDPIVDALSFSAYKNLRSTTGSSYSKAVLGGNAPKPKKSYSSQLFTASGGGGI